MLGELRMIYFDNSATTKIDPSALETYQKVAQDIWGNPSSLHELGDQAFQMLETARKQVASLLGFKPYEIFFTSGGTESDNWAIKGTALAKREFGRHIITSSVEHPAVMNSVLQLEQLGFEVTILPVDASGRVSVADLRQAIRKDTILVSIMAVNNEIGAIQPIQEIGDLLEDYPTVHFHVDAVQGLGKNLWQKIYHRRIDLMSFSGHKFHGPRGIGILYKKERRQIAPLMTGGGQERDLRSGTENTPAIAAMAKALRLLLTDEPEKAEHQLAIKGKIYDYLKDKPGIQIFSPLTDDFSPHVLCFSLVGIRGETVVHTLESKGIYFSTTSACSSKKGIESSTLKAMQVPEKVATSAVRLSFDENNTMAEADEFIATFEPIYQHFYAINHHGNEAK